MNIGIIDADLLGRKNHRFPNLASMKISGYYKELGNNVELLLSYDDVDKYDKVFISKVFTDTFIDESILNKDNVEFGGTGFFYDTAKPLPYEIEHNMPDYHLYDEWVNVQLENGVKRKDLAYYLDYSIGFTTRGCFRHCEFCVNKNYNKVELHSPVNEFLNKDKKYICLLDDNILGSPKWKDVFEELNSTGKKFQFKQGMDERLLTDEKCEVLLKSNYIKDYIFAFDNIDDKEIIEEKLKLWRKYNKNKGQDTKFYVLCGYDRNEKYDDEFWKQDIIDVFERLIILMKYNIKPYIMRHKNHEKSPFKGTYTNLAGWCNQPSLFKKLSYREFCIKSQLRQKNQSKTSSYMRYLNEFESKYPEIAKKYFDLKFDDINNF